MADTLPPEMRSRVMASVKGRGTSPEVFVRRAIWKHGFRYRLNVRRLPGTPDLVLAQYKVAIFVHGCFWHQHGCLRSKRPASNRDYWDRKLDRNVDRDAMNRSRLEELGWSVITIWECQLQDDTDGALHFLTELRANRTKRQLEERRIGQEATI